MSTIMQKNNPATGTGPSSASRLEGAQAMLDTVETMRQGIPKFAFPVIPGARVRLNGIKSVSPDFMEQSNVALKSEPALARGGVDPDEMRDLVSYALAYTPVADALEFLAREMRESVDTARAKAGSEALNTYALASRLARRPETARLMPLVQSMRRTLGRTKKAKPAAAKQPPVTPPPGPVPVTPAPVPPAHAVALDVEPAAGPQ